jgi:hypothetical protein
MMMIISSLFFLVCILCNNATAVDEARIKNLRPSNRNLQSCGKLACYKNSECIVNSRGIAKCVCLDGFVAKQEGEACVRKPAGCETLKCGVNSSCVENENGRAKCECLNGFVPKSNGCAPIPKPKGCDVTVCPGKSKCVENPKTGKGICNCFDGFLRNKNGDCEPRFKPLRCSAMKCPSNSKCIENGIGQGTCLCVDMYIRDNITGACIHRNKKSSI